MRACTPIMLGSKEIKYASTAKYLGVILRAGKCFSIDINYAKSNFFIPASTQYFTKGPSIIMN